MYPTNQIILGGDTMMNPLANPLNPMEDIDTQIERMKLYKERLNKYQNPQHSMIWNDIDAEVNPMTNEQKSRLMQDPEYSEINNELQLMVQAELLNLVKGRIENTEKGRDLLNRQLKIVRRLKNKIVEATNREMEMFMAFREYSKTNPNITYDEFIKQGQL